MRRSTDPDQYVNANREQLTQIIKQSPNDFARALALAALVEYGDDATIESVTTELERLVEATDKEI